MILERPQQCEIGVSGAAFDLPAAAETPRELCLLGAESGCNPTDLAQRDLALKRLLQPGAAQRGLPGMHPLEHERLGEVRSLAAGQQPGPQLVVLALGVRRVITQLSAVDVVAIHQHRRVEERRAEQRQPADARGACRVAVKRARPAGRIEIEHGGTDNCRAFTAALHSLELARESFGQRNVVGVETGDEAPLCFGEPAVEREGQSRLLVIRDHAQARVAHSREQRRRLVRGSVIDDDQLEVVDGLAQDARHGLAEEARVVANGQQDGDERHGR